MRKKFFHYCLLNIMAILFLLLAGPEALAAGRAKSVIVLIVDGCSSEQYTFARWFKGSPLALDAIQVGAVKTYSADSVLSDSASAASAFASGVRTSNKHISVGPHEKTLSVVPPPAPEIQYRPFATVLEGAKLMEKATGIVATSRVSHATPAAFISHSSSRNDEDDIMEQAVYQNIDVVFGGGKRYLLPAEEKGIRPDGENLLEILKSRGYQLVETRDGMMRLTSGKVFGMFASSHMDAEIDRLQLNPGQPSLKEMTQKAIEILSKDPDGFFLMVEASQVDWACHANDPAHLLSDLLAFDDAVGAALDFAREDKSTMVLAFSDHNTGGFSIGNYATDGIYPQMQVEPFLDPFRKMKVSAATLWSRIGDEKTSAKVKEAVSREWGMDITEEDAQRIVSLASKYKGNGYDALGEILSAKYTPVGWTTHGHCGGDVPLFAYGPGKPQGLLDGPDIATVCARALGLNLARLNDRLFVDPEKAIPGAIVTLNKVDPNNPLVKIEYRGKWAELPVNKNILRMDSREIPLEGIVVCAPETGMVYLPMQAVRLITGTSKPLPSVLR